MENLPEQEDKRSISKSNKKQAKQLVYEESNCETITKSS